VWYRGWTEQKAHALNLDGWIKNKRDGSVEGLFSGPSEAVDQMIKQCWSGPPLANVTAIHDAPEPEIPGPGFLSRPSETV
jgi:acylphosphatase